MGYACRLGRFQVQPETLFRLRADRDGGRSQVGKVDGERLQAVYQGQGEVFRQVGRRCRLDLAGGNEERIEPEEKNRPMATTDSTDGAPTLGLCLEGLATVGNDISGELP